jgi:hypothetical protein
VTLRRKLGDVTNDKDMTPPNPKRRRHLSSPGSEDEDEEQVSRSDDNFVYQAGHKFFLIYGPWIHLGEGLFDTEFIEAFNTAERFENDENKAQGQLHEIWSLLQGKFGHEILQQKWVHRAVRYAFIH